jgi:hypothetical protein
MSDCKKLFPKWATTRHILTEYVNGIRGWKVTRGPRNVMRISLDSSIDTLVPVAHRSLLYRLIETAVSGGLPDLSSFLGSPNDSVTQQSVLRLLNDHMAALIRRGEPDLKSRIAELWA